MQPGKSTTTSAGPPRTELLAAARGLESAIDADLAAARPRIEAVVDQARRRRDPEALAWGLRARAIALRYTGDPAGAARLLGQALAVARRAGNDSLRAWVLASRSSVLLDLGRTARSRTDAAEALRIVDARRATERGLDDLHVRVRLQLAVMDHNAGRLREAEAGYRSILGEVPPDTTDAVRVANNLALVLVARTEYGEALRWAQRAVDDAVRLSPSLRSWPYLTRALIRVHTGGLADGLRDLERAARAATEAGQPPGEYYLEYAETMRELRLLPEAAAAGRRALDELVAGGDGLVVVDALVSLADTLLLLGDAAGAVENAEQARARARAQRRPGSHDRAVLIHVRARRLGGTAAPADLAAVGRAARRLERSHEMGDAADAYLEGGRLAAALGLPRRAVRHLDTAATLAQRGPLSVRLRGRLAAALAARLRGSDDGVLAACRTGLRDLARHRDTLPTMELRALASGHGAQLGELGLEVVVRRGSPAAVLRWMEQTRAAALQTAGDADPGGARGDRQDTAEAGADAASDGRTSDGAPADGTPTAGVVARRSVIVADDAQAADARRSAWLEGVVTPRGSVTRAPGPDAVRAALGTRVLVEYGRYGDRLVAVVVERTRARVVDLGEVLPDVEGTLRALVFALRRMVDPRSPAAVDAARASADLRLRRLRSVLVEPLGVGPDVELVVVPVGLLHGAPWSALHDGPVALAPSAASWLRTAGPAPVSRGQVVLVAGPGLQGAQDEVEALRGLHARVQVLGAGASRADVVVDAIAGADLAHLACHGALRSDNPMFSSVELADGPVTVQELHRAGAAPQRLVLASCHSGADVAYDGDEVLGLVSAMLSRGTRGVVASIAAVPDVEVVDLMLALHRRLVAGQTMARALHGARGEIDRGTPGGFVNWCTFSAHGAA
ncbi:tetratricopeptide TPR_4 [Cellulomonas flavigena DSM 20109]|uniref:Tetratricopeptide TPR_4 n=1 Tax=Cellulomonas flavigena (strain ATCC 482 / DSM 20109 / BCRC 11376 / JCM 18109 / NBRC 3775 / NCIMB 8073 / NRS 134) TaxID=446466 RepID=D5UIZ1_CELFN|nr:CHAT domain-containing tetratricopeptide repeat protein [Cellulomonas flavigena]ADG75557.1 tetratricopeptide TPR_4 [Cellulomonas flavigena DSM 20109]